MLKFDNPNPLQFFNLRKQEVPISHFEYVEIPTKYNLEQSINNWIYTHLKGRYYVGICLTVEGTKIKVGFEEKKELSYFMLACPHLKYS